MADIIQRLEIVAGMIECADQGIKWGEDTALMREAASVIDELTTALHITASNIQSLRASCNCKTYDKWLDLVDGAIRKAEGEQ